MKNTELFNESHRATYCPESDLLHLYVGRVPKEEYLALKAEGWRSTPKQSEAGQGEFAATWSVARENTAVSYAGIIEDEDASPQDRAADRAERFSGYLDKRLSEATGHAGRFDDGPQVHGFQSYARAVKSADRHDKHASRAVSAWDKAEYWQSRTAGVISHALYKSSPGVRMGRIKTIEAEIRKAEKSHSEWCAQYRRVKEIAADPAPLIAHTAARYEDGDSLAAERRIADTVLGCHGVEFTHPRDPERKGSPWRLMDPEKPDPITLAEACGLWLAQYKDPEGDVYENRALNHLKLRVAYELQMLEAQGGRAALVEMEVGGFIGSYQIRKVNKSPATGRVVSVQVLGRVRKYDRKTGEETMVDSLETLNIERLSESSYRAPTDEERASLAATVKAEKDTRPKSSASSLINPTLEDAQRLQEVWNTRITRQSWDKDPLPVVRSMTQVQYSTISQGSYSSAKTSEITGGGFLLSGSRMGMSAENFPAVAKVRRMGDSVVFISDKPAKAFPAAVWHDPRPAVIEEVRANFGLLKSAVAHAWLSDMTPEESAIFTKARLVGIARCASMSQFGLTDKGMAVES